MKTEMKKALPIYVYRHETSGQSGKNCLSNRHSKLLLLCDEGFIDVDMTNPPENLVVIDSIKTGVREPHFFIRPYAKPKAAGWMAGSNIGYTCDSRFGYNYPLQIHDLDEDWDTYYEISNS